MRLFALSLLACLLCAAGSRHPALVHPSPVPKPAGIAAAPEARYSRRALRQARLIVQMRLLQLRREGLECVRRTILLRLPPDLRPLSSSLSRSGRSGRCPGLWL